MASQRNGGIAWCDETWNPTRGCSRVSPGCVNCYAERQAARFAGFDMGPAEFTARKEGKDLPPFFGFVNITNGHPAWTGKVELIESKLREPLHFRTPKRIFVNSMSDLFHEALSDEAIDQVFAVMALCPQQTFQVLTKRPERMRKYLSGGTRHTPIIAAMNALGLVHAGIAAIRWPLRNVWLGVSVEDQQRADERIPLLLRAPATVRFASYEPALAPVDFRRFLGPQKMYLGLDRDGKRGNNSIEWGLDWIIVGGESGPGARPFDIAWGRNTVAQCKAAGVACFVKQLGSRPFIAESHSGNWTDWNPRVVPYRGEDGEIRGFEAQLADKKGGGIDEWPEDLRVRQFPDDGRAAA